MKKTTLILAVIIFGITVFSCGGDKNGNSMEKGQANVKNTQKKQSAPKMTVERSAQLDFECAALLMDNYWDTFKDKNYADIKDAYTKYYNQKEEIYRKYGVTKHGWNNQKYVYWKMDHKSDLRAYRKTHPEYDFYKKYPHYKDALMGLSKLDEEKWQAEK